MRFVEGEYEPASNVLRLWHPRPVTLNEPRLVEQFFEDVVGLLKACPRPPHLLVDYRNFQIAAEMTQFYAKQVQAYRHLTVGVFRYNLSPDTEGVLTKVAILVANRAAANIFPDERSAREAIRKAQLAPDTPPV
jgi:hypothetical protein